MVEAVDLAVQISHTITTRPSETSAPYFEGHTRV